MPDILVIANRNAGTADEERLRVAVDVLRNHGEVDVRWSGDVAELDDVLDAIDGRRVVVAGGDGSIHAVVQRLWQRDCLSGVDLALLPLGTGNDLATGLDLATDPAAAAAVAMEGDARELDLLVTDDGHVVVNASHAGLGAAAAERSEGMKDALGPLAYPVGALIAGVREAAWDLRVSLDGEVVHEGSTLMVGIANAPSIGGGTRLIPPALPDDGQLDVIVVTAIGPAARLAFAVALRDAAHLNREDVLHLRGSTVTIEGEPVAHDLDGEVIPDLETCTYRVLPRAWQLRVPADLADGAQR